MLGLNNGIYLGFKENETASRSSLVWGALEELVALVDLVYVKWLIFVLLSSFVFFDEFALYITRN